MQIIYELGRMELVCLNPIWTENRNAKLKRMEP
jgi:hypothetical protein